jgi:integrase
VLTETAIEQWLATAPVGALLWDAQAVEKRRRAGDAPAGEKRHRAGELPGFGVRRWRTRATFVLAYRVGRRARWLTLGTVGADSLAKARRRARIAIGDVSDGTDPAAARDEVRAAETVREAGERWLAHVASLRKRGTAAEYRRLWARSVLPRLGSLPVREVTTADVARIHAALRGTPGEANHVLGVLSSFFTWAARLGMRPPHLNPCRGVPRYAEPPRTRYLSAAELGRLGAALAQAARAESLTVTADDGTKHTEPVSRTALRIIRLLALTGARLDEIRALRWDAIDAAAGLAHLADSKTGPKTLALSREALAVLREVPRFVHSPFVFPAEGTRGRLGEHFVNVNRTWALVRHAAQLDDVRIHDLRHTAAGIAASAGVSLPVIGKMLGHTQPATTARYAHVAAHPAAQAAALVSKSVAGALAAGAQARKVRPFRARSAR